MELADVLLSDDDLMLAALKGLPPEYAVVKTVLLADETSTSFKEFHTHLLVAEQAAKTLLSSLPMLMVAMVSQRSSTPRTSHDDILSTLHSTSVNTVTGFHVHPRPSGSFGRSNCSGHRSFNRGGFSGNRFSSHPSSSSAVLECQICQKRDDTVVNYCHRNSSSQNSTSASVIKCQI